MAKGESTSDLRDRFIDLLISAILSLSIRSEDGKEAQSELRRRKAQAIRALFGPRAPGRPDEDNDWDLMRMAVHYRRIKEADPNLSERGTVLRAAALSARETPTATRQSHAKKLARNFEKMKQRILSTDFDSYNKTATLMANEVLAILDIMGRYGIEFEKEPMIYSPKPKKQTRKRPQK